MRHRPAWRQQPLQQQAETEQMASVYGGGNERRRRRERIKTSRTAEMQVDGALTLGDLQTFLKEVDEWPDDTVITVRPTGSSQRGEQTGYLVTVQGAL